jgi:hypothetical protein
MHQMSRLQSAASVPEPAIAPISATPDWEHEQREIVCPLCAYNLRGLVEPRCPECGYRFTWDELLDPTRALHPYLYEHHPERGIRSFWRTAVAGLWPPSFWRTLSPTQPSKPRRLARYALNVVLLLALLPALVMLIRYGLDAVPFDTRFARNGWPTYWGVFGSFSYYQWRGGLPLTVAALIDLALRPTENLPGFIASFAAAAVVWAVATYAGLMIFQQSMGKAAVRGGHVARCIVYAADFAMWPSVVLSAVLLAQWALRLENRLYLCGTLMGGSLALLFFPVAILRLITAYRRYLRFDHPVATVLAVQVILALAALLALCVCYAANFG